MTATRFDYGGLGAVYVADADGAMVHYIGHVHRTDRGGWNAHRALKPDVFGRAGQATTRPVETGWPDRHNAAVALLASFRARFPTAVAP